MLSTAMRDGRLINFVERVAPFESPLIDYRAKGHQLTLQGMSKFDGRDVYFISAELKSGRTEEFYIDATTFLLVKRHEAFTAGQWNMTQSLLYFDYEPVEGVMLPFYIEREIDPNVHGMVVEAVEVNPEIDASFFWRGEKD